MEGICEFADKGEQQRKWCGVESAQVTQPQLASGKLSFTGGRGSTGNQVGKGSSPGACLLMCLFQPGAEAEQQILNRRCRNRVDFTSQNLRRATTDSIVFREAKVVGQDYTCTELAVNVFLIQCIVLIWHYTGST